MGQETRKAGSPWSEKFEYNSVLAMQLAGWNTDYAPWVNGQLIWMSEGELTLQSNASTGWYIWRREWVQPNVYDWRVTAIIKGIEPNLADALIHVTVNNSSVPNSSSSIDYISHIMGHDCEIDQSYPTAANLVTIAWAFVPCNTWFNFTLERNGQVLETYLDGVQIVKANLPQESGYLRGIGVGIGGNSKTKFDSLEVSYVIGPKDNLNLFPNLYLDLIVGTVCVALSGFLVPLRVSGKRFALVNLLIFMTGIAIILFFGVKCGLPEVDSITLFASAVIGLCVSLIFEEYRTRAGAGLSHLGV